MSGLEGERVSGVNDLAMAAACPCRQYTLAVSHLRYA